MMQLQYNVRTYRSTQTAQQRIGGLVFIAALHAGIIYALLTALRVVPMAPVPQPFQWHVIPDNTIPPPPPIPQDPSIPRPRFTDIAPPIVDVYVEQGPTAITPTASQPPPAEPPDQRVATLESPPLLPLTLIPARAIAATHTIPDYPPVSRRLSEQGTLRLRVSITAEGAVSDAQIESSSGHTRLDDAAAQWVKAHWRYEPAREGAKAVSSTTLAVVTFKLQ